MRLVTLTMVAALALGGCRAGMGSEVSATPVPITAAPDLAAPDAVDTASFARPQEARVTHISLDLAVDFQAKRLSGVAILDIDRRPDARAIILDDDRLEISSITDAMGRPLDYQVGPRKGDFGSPLSVALRPDTRKIVIRYRSAPDSTALQWLAPDQTAGKRLPYLFSQGQSILNRSWIPLQDTPLVRQTWDAHIVVPAEFKVVMSAPQVAWNGPAVPPTLRDFTFRMDKPVPAYVIAIAVGDLAFRPLSPNTGVWSEPAVVDAAAREFADIPAMMAAAERLYGPYDWGRYDMLVLPPSFPYGGMENPVMTFLTPSLIAGDKSLVSVVAHELAHSWSGNLVTNATWGDGWLNEGFTTYAERRIIEEVYGKKVADQQISLSLDTMKKAMEEVGGPTNPDTRLNVDLAGRHPDDIWGDVAYEKGAAFLRMIESEVGRQRFDAWMRDWFATYAYKAVTSAMFLDHIRDRLVKGDRALEARLRLEEWLYQPGVPANLVPADPAAFAEVDAVLAAFLDGGAPDVAAWARFNTDERLRFLTRLPRKLPAARLATLNQAFGLNAAHNMEVRFAWLDLAIANRFDPATASIEEFLGAIGRGKFVRPLYKALMADPWGQPIARRAFERSRALYHSSVLRELKSYGLST